MNSRAIIALLLAFLLCGCEKRAEPVKPPTHAPLERSMKRPEVESGSPLEQLILQGRCYASKTHVLCANDQRLGHWEYPKLILVGSEGVLHLTNLQRLESKDDERGMRFRDDARFESERARGDSLLETIPAPAYVSRAEKRFVKCGQRVVAFEPMPSAQSKAWLQNAELRVPPPAISISAMKTGEGVYLVEVTREGSGVEKSTRLHIGPIDAIEEVQVVDSNVVLDQGYREFLLPEGGRVFYPLNPRMPAAGEAASLLPDGSKLLDGQRLRGDFRWSTYRPTSSSEERRLFVVSPEDRKRLDARFESKSDASVERACSLIFKEPG